MGWVYGFHVLDPEIVREVLSLSPDGVRQRLVERGFSPEQVGIESWEDEDLDENEALTLLATSREWDIDKSLADIQRIPGLDPRLTPLKVVLREMESFDSSQLPRRFHPRELGLMGIAMPPTLAVAALAAAPFVGPAGRRALTEVKDSLAERLLGGRLRGRLRTNDYLWQHWLDFVSAVQTASSRSAWLGLHMS